jgi:hypothetical protein
VVIWVAPRVGRSGWDYRGVRTCGGRIRSSRECGHDEQEGNDGHLAHARAVPMLELSTPQSDNDRFLARGQHVSSFDCDAPLKVYPNLIYFNEVDKGGHFAAWEEPQIFSEEMRAAFRSLR